MFATPMKNLHYWYGTASFFVVGLGQVLKGEGKKGLMLLLIFYLALPALIYLSLMLDAYLFLSALGVCFLSGIIIWVYNFWDALTHATNI